MSATKRGHYHHGDLRAALITTASQLIAEDGLSAFTLAAVSRRLGVAQSAPYAHFSDRNELLAAVAVHALDLFQRDLEAALTKGATPRERLAIMVGAYVGFAAAHKALFEVLFQLPFDKRRYPALANVENSIEGAFRKAVRDVLRNREPSTEEMLAAAVEAVAHGHATLVLDGRFGRSRSAAAHAAESAARATLALITGWHRAAPEAAGRKAHHH